MTPYYEDDACTIYHGDSREVLASLSAAVNVVLTDPPYGVGLGYDSYDDSSQNLAAIVEDQIPFQALAPVVALTPGVANLWAWPKPTWALCLHTPGATSTGPWGFNEWQPVLVYGPDPYLRLGLGRRPDVIRGQSESPHSWNDHPCPKPLTTWTRLLTRVSASVDDLILDPFMGSGTTLVAAKYSGRKAIGIEISERYCEIAAKRLAQEVLAL